MRDAQIRENTELYKDLLSWQHKEYHLQPSSPTPQVQVSIANNMDKRQSQEHPCHQLNSK